MLYSILLFFCLLLSLLQLNLQCDFVIFYWWDVIYYVVLQNLTACVVKTYTQTILNILYYNKVCVCVCASVELNLFTAFLPHCYLSLFRQSLLLLCLIISYSTFAQLNFHALFICFRFVFVVVVCWDQCRNMYPRMRYTY